MGGLSKIHVLCVKKFFTLLMQVNLRHGIGKDRTEKDTCTACAGSMLLEFSALSRLTGDMIFEVRYLFF